MIFHPTQTYGVLLSESFHPDLLRVREEIQAALSTVPRTGFGDSHSLCHGDLGNLELLVSAASEFTDSDLRLRADRIARGVVDDIRGRGWQCGNPLRVESPGLMTGPAGIGYGLLRLAHPERVPSVLVLEPPRPRQGDRNPEPG